MNTKSLLILVVLLVVGVAAYLFSTGSGRINSSSDIGSAILPGLYEALNDVNKIQLVGAGENVVATLEQKGNVWLVAERNDYPADIAKIRGAVLAVAEAKIVEQKTSNKELYSKLGVEDVSNKDAGGVQVNVHYGEHVQALIVGKPGPQINKNRYVRRKDDDTSWLVDRKLDLQHDVTYWLQKDILSVEPNEVTAVSITMPDGSRLDIKKVADSEEQDKFAVTNLTDPNSQVIDAELHQVTNALSSFQLLDVLKKSEFIDIEPELLAAYVLHSGAVIALTGYEVDKDHYVTIDVSVDESQEDNDAAKSFIKELTLKTQGWVFKIPNVSYDSMLKREQDVLAITEDQLN